MDKPKVICIDLDGVLVDLHHGLVRLFGEDPEKYTEAQWAEVGEWGLSIPKGDFWGKVRSQGLQWWINLPKLPWTDELWQAALDTGATCVVLTTPAPFPESSYGKWQWVYENLNTRNVLIGQPKEICAQPGTWLIDDRAGYGPRWEGRGGRLLSLKRPWNPNGLDIQEILAILREVKA
ncbi:MAG: HAD family hydrolase [Proteobacteria bacterium]|nr:HAD family hydrolase [Pseudomonadota bacterium]